eukprot:7387053-Prymnesium_polylepis.2
MITVGVAPLQSIAPSGTGWLMSYTYIEQPSPSGALPRTPPGHCPGPRWGSAPDPRWGSAPHPK